MPLATGAPVRPAAARRGAGVSVCSGRRPTPGSPGSRLLPASGRDRGPRRRGSSRRAAAGARAGRSVTSVFRVLRVFGGQYNSRMKHRLFSVAALLGVIVVCPSAQQPVSGPPLFATELPKDEFAARRAKVLQK